ncbi:hypothetical protein SCH01S_51_00730 [Sphingomonas changbaiensis NBRC 104936]|uniref:Metallo-beta-lactamase domain-containing protein n=1 Tax=Sphingomonas changbaiensis NBRC 104936 TaxID=1219043 RepID=A0A0E9MTH7_9SPHN|nr:MBL fold metallo-hydrolase [Sphingomonas changbaiensis]GAO40741.1 hypothetical protein SCH01S_51_00730 [Sphingomonas changbaiensis NBRC 104936]
MSFPNDFFEVDFLAVETAKSGDAITIRSAINGIQYVNVVDGGFTDMGETILEHLNAHYSNQSYIDNVVLTHSDGDHARGLKHILENGTVNALWMNRPWLYADELVNRFKNYTNVDNLRKKLRECYPNVADLEDIAIDKGIPIYEAFQGANIGHFTVMAPSKGRYLDLIVDSEKTPEPAAESATYLLESLYSSLKTIVKATANFIKAAWGEEVFPAQGTSCENEMSVIQYANIGGVKVVLTGDAGRGALSEMISYSPYVGLTLPGIDRFQVPHHGSRRNVSTELLDTILGSRLDGAVSDESATFSAFISSAKADPDHPRKAVERAMHHRGGKVLATEGQNIRTGWNAPARVGWSGIAGRPYPTEQEE